MNQPTVHYTDFRVEKSYLTNREIVVNEGSGFLIPPSFSIENLHVSVSNFLVDLRKNNGFSRHSNMVEALGEKFLSIDSRASFTAHVEELIAFRNENKSAGYEGARIRYLFIHFWRENCIVFPQAEGGIFPISIAKNLPWGPVAQELQDQFQQRQFQDTTSYARVRTFSLLLLSRSNVLEFGDLTPNVCSDYFSTYCSSKVRPSTISDIISIQIEEHGKNVIHGLSDYGSILREAPRSDENFPWVLKEDPTLVEWVEIAKRQMQSQDGNRLNYFSTWNSFFDHLIANPDEIRDPVSYFHVERGLRTTYTPKTDKSKSILRKIYDWILENVCVYEDEYGGKATLPGHRNPLAKEKRKRRAGESPRSPMPTYLVRRLIEVLTKDDFAWPRKYAEPRWNKKGGDYLTYKDIETGEERKIWSPVRAVAILLKLYLPIRTFQARVLDSGEADYLRYDRVDNAWHRNENPLAASANTEDRRGVFHRHIADDGEEFTFLYINTNKLRDTLHSDEGFGYVIPWQHEAALNALTYLRDWQTQHNPIHRPTAWTEIQQLGIARGKSNSELIRRGSNCFLFRDASTRLKSQPVTDMRLRTFWVQLNLELERRLAEENVTDKKGKPVVLVRRVGKSLQAVFDLHTLRVTHITAYLAAGVPIHIVMKVVSHETVAMLLHYDKVSPTHISDVLTQSKVEIDKQERDRWLEWLTEQAHSTLISATAHSDFAAVEALRSAPKAAWILRDHGICPVGCGRCDEGGEVIVRIASVVRYAPVPGGPRNCVRCRFFISGPAFLQGLNSHFDMVGFQLREASKTYQIHKAKFESLESECARLSTEHQPISARMQRSLEQASGIYDESAKLVDELALSWHATYRLIGQSLAIARKQTANDVGKQDKLSLIALGGHKTIEAVLEKSTEFELADRVCQSSVFFDSIDAKAANLKRMRAFDAMLSNNGFQPRFFNMDESTAIIVGNQMSKLLFSSLGREQTNNLLQGSLTLKRLGLDIDFDKALQEISNNTLENMPLRIGL